MEISEEMFGDDETLLKITLNSVVKVNFGAVDKVNLLHALIQKAEDYGVECDGQVEEVGEYDE